MKKTIIILLTLIILAVSVQSQYYKSDYGSSAEGGAGWSTYGNATVELWYQIYDWEYEVCKLDSGATTPASTDGSIVTEISELDKTSLTLQGYKTTLTDSTLYEIAWYVQPKEGDTTYTIYLGNQDSCRSHR